MSGGDGSRTTARTVPHARAVSGMRACLQSTTPQQAHASWYTRHVLGEAGDGGAERLVQQCDWGCNAKCPLYT